MAPFLTPPPVRDPKTPRHLLPAGTVDCHMHLFGPPSRYPVYPETTYITEDALPETFIGLMDRFGIAIGNFIPASPQGTDPSHLVDVLTDFPERFIGVAIVDHDVTDKELARLAAVGVKGARFQSPGHGSKLPALTLETAARVADLGWHVQLFPSGTEIIELEPLVRAVPAPVVFDHFGSVPAEAGTGQPAFAALLRLIDTGRVWVKLSRPMQITREDPPYPSVIPLAHALIEHAPERVLWGTDWPHVGLVGRTMPDDGDLVDLIWDWVPDERDRQRVLVENPNEFYRLDRATKAVGAGMVAQ
jgi:2-pyrone-4,6-dicarboxylate lactonase